jgi:hypothetical protein
MSFDSALSSIELMDSSQHVDDFPEFEQQWEWTFLRAEVAIRHILTVWKAGSPSLIVIPAEPCRLKWRRGRDSNSRWGRPHGGFQDHCLKPLGHLSK